MLKLINYSLILILTLILFNCSSKETITPGKNENLQVPLTKKIEIFKNDVIKRHLSFQIPLGSKVKKFEIDSSKKLVKIKFNRHFSFLPFREDNVSKIYSEIKKYFGNDLKNYKFSILTLGYPIEDLIPNYFRKNKEQYDKTRIPHQNNKKPNPLVKNISKGFAPVDGLFGKNIVVAPSHGWYYNNKESRWEWQRPRLFQTVEDLLPSSFCIPYLIPMLENAGAVVFDPRERNIQTHSVVVDNDSRYDVSSKYYIEKSNDKRNVWQTGKGEGFAAGNPPYPSDYNPFSKGTYKTIKTNTIATASVSWIPNIPSTEYYSVYISYHASDTNASDVKYILYHEGIKTEYRVNQQIGGNTWIYLGEFKFAKGYHPNTDKVELLNESREAGKIITADAVRFGGGMGVIERGGRTSGRPKFVEGSRYYLQYAGIPDSLYNFNNNSDDYNDDKQDRSKYVNYLNGSSLNNKHDKGLGIPIDLSLAFHTDAGVTHNNTTIGTLALYGLKGENSKPSFPNGASRLASRDLADIMQTQIVNDIRAKFDPNWNRRQLMDEQPSNDAYPQQYSEVYRPNVPAVLIELLSHQNFLDQKFAQDPRFRFHVSRAMYKGMLRFLSVQDHFKYVVEPLPVIDFRSEMNGDSVKLSWEPTVDSLEPTAKAERYIVYTRIDSGDFDNGQIIDHTYAELGNIQTGHIYSYKVTAINSGGESFPSEILSVCRMKGNQKKVLIVNGFDRVSSPATVSTPGYVGFVNGEDRGVPYKYDIGFTGREYNYDSTSQWKTNDDPGWGASRSDYEGKVIVGNTYDYPYVHGKALMENGYGFESASVKSVEKGEINLRKYSLIDIILGEQKKTDWERAREDTLRGIEYKTMPAKLQKEIRYYVEGGGNILVSGAYVGSDLFRVKPVDTADIAFAENILKYKLDAEDGSSGGGVYSADSEFMPKFKGFKYNTKLNDKIYAVENPDAIGEMNGSKVIQRYSENEFPAGIGYRGKYGVIVMGIPFETILGEQAREEVMKSILSYFGL
jgi:hypothetical protein